MTLKSAGKTLALIVISGVVVVSASGVVAYQPGLKEEKSPGFAQQGEIDPVITEDTSFSGQIPPYNATQHDFVLRVEEGETATLSVTNENSTHRLIVEILSPGNIATPALESGESLEFTYPGDSVEEPPYEYTITLRPSEEIGATGPPLEEFQSSYAVSVDFSDNTSTGTETPTPTETTPQLSNTLSIRSTSDERAYYNATTSDSIAPGPGADLTGADQPDEVSDATASGSTAQGGVDNYTFSGELTELNLTGGAAEVYVNGEQVDPADYQTTPTPTPTPIPTPTLTSTPTPTPTPTETPTPTPTQTAAPTTTPSATQTPTVTPRETRTGTENRTSTMVTTETEVGQLVRTMNGTSTDDQTDVFGPGFGIGGTVIAAVAVVLVGLLQARRRR